MDRARCPTSTRTVGGGSAARLERAVRRLLTTTLALALALPPLFPLGASAQTPPATTVTLDERVVPQAQLPAGPLAWRLETLPTADAADAAKGPTGVAGAFGGKN